MNLKNLISGLINKKYEGSYWDFKRLPHKNNEDLLHDILSLSNVIHEGDRFLIIGVSDPVEGCEIIGLNENTENRKKEADLNDFLNNLTFAERNVPKVNIRTLNFENKEIDVIIIKNSHLKPFYLEKDYNNLKAYHIYSRIGDRNTPKNKSANFFDIKEMWKEHFGLNLNVEERFKRYLKDFKNWKLEFDSKESAFYKIDSDFTIKFTESVKTSYVEPLNTYFLNNSCFFGNILFKCKDTEIFNCGYYYCDEYRTLIPEPEFYFLKNDPDNIVGFYYYNLEEINGLFASLITKGSFDFKTRTRKNFPFILVPNEKILNKFTEELKVSFDQVEKIDYIFNKYDPNKYTSPINLEYLEGIKIFYEKWLEEINQKLKE